MSPLDKFTYFTWLRNKVLWGLIHVITYFFFLTLLKLYIVDAYAFHLPEVPDFIMEEADASV